MRLYPHTDEEVSRYSWDDFIDLTVYLTNVQGSALYDASLGDAEMIEQMYQDAVRKQSSKRLDRAVKDELEWRPPRRGYSREVEAIYDLTSNIVAMRGEFGRWPVTTTERQMPKRPWFPSEMVENRLRNRNVGMRDQRIEEAKARNRAKRKVAADAG